jgi:hypothetical protein
MWGSRRFVRGSVIGTSATTHPAAGELQSFYPDPLPLPHLAEYSDLLIKRQFLPPHSGARAYSAPIRQRLTEPGEA